MDVVSIDVPFNVEAVDASAAVSETLVAIELVALVVNSCVVDCVLTLVTWLAAEVLVESRVPLVDKLLERSLS